MRPLLRRSGTRFAVGLVVLATATGGLTATSNAEPAPSAPPGNVSAKPDGNWVSAWSAAPQGTSTLGKLGVETLSGDTQLQAVQKIVPPPTTFSDETIRQVMYLHHGGNAVRVKLSNQFGKEPTTLGPITVGKRAGDDGAAIQPGSKRALTVDGERTVEIPPGEDVLSDPVRLPLKAFDHLVLSMHVPAGNPAATVHGNAMQSFFTAKGDQSDARSDAAFSEQGIMATPYTATFTSAVYYATGIHVESTPDARTLVALGDSITDGFFSSGNTNNRFPDHLARRLKADPATDHLSVTNQAISAGRVTADDVGPSTLNRLQTQVFDQPNVAGVVFLQGINDLGNTLFQDRPRSAEELIAGYKKLADAIHARGLPVYIGTLTPAGDLLRPTPFGMYSLPTVNIERNKVNDWLRTEGRQVFDGVIDYDAAVRNPVLPEWIDFKYDSLDNLHPNDAGYELMANSIPKKWLARMGK